MERSFEWQECSAEAIPDNCCWGVKLLVEAYSMGRCCYGARSNSGLQIGPVLKVVGADDFGFKSPPPDWTKPVRVSDLSQLLVAAA